MNVLSLFDGISCGQVALNNLNIKIDNYFASEVDKYAISVTKKRFPNTKFIGDVKWVSGDSLPKIDLLMGGSPCTQLSMASNNGGKTGLLYETIDDYMEAVKSGESFGNAQSQLFWEYFRILNEVKPKYFLLENVRMSKFWEEKISNHLGCEPILLNSRLFTAQNRARLFWTNIDVKGIEEIKDKNLKFGDIRDEKADNVEEDDPYIRLWSEDQMKKYHEKIFVRRDYYRVFKDEDKINCLLASMGSNRHKCVYLKNPKRFRYLTPLEWERLQGLPDKYTDIDNILSLIHI